MTSNYRLPITDYWSSWLLALGLLLTGVGGGFLPWIWRESVALQLTGPGLAEFVKFLAEVRTLQLQVTRLHFLYPLFLAMLAIPILIENRTLQLPRWLRWGLRLAVFPLALASISPVWDPEILLNAEFRTQTILALLAMGMAVIAPLGKSLPFRFVVIVYIIFGVVAVILPWRQFNLVQTAIAAAYNEPVVLGWGWWVTVSGIGLSMVGGLVRMLLPSTSPATPARH